MRPPGVYAAFVDPARPPLEIADTRVTGFVGLTLKGPLNQPVRIANWDEFVETFGYTSEHYLSDAVHAFFRNGGTACRVVRVAHLPPADGGPVAELGADHAACAEHIQVDDWNKPSLKIRALNEGRWGNLIWVKCLHATGASALLTRDLDVGAGEAHVNTVRGFEVGALVRIYDKENSDYVVLTEIGDKLIKWGKETPVNRRHRAAAPTQLEVMEFEIHIALRDRREVFKNLQMHPTSRHYAPRVIASRSRLIRIEDLATKSPVPHNLPEPLPMIRLTGGRDGTEKVTPEDFLGHDFGPSQRSGLAALAAEEEVALLAIPDAMIFHDRERGPAGEMKAQRIQDAMISVCENQKDRFAILDIPMSKDIEWVQRWRRRTDSSFCAYYWPWLSMVGPEGGKPRPTPPSGPMAGIYALKDTKEGVHCAPANAAVVGADDLALRVTEDHLGVLNASSVNTFRLQRGVRPWGARTASSDPDWRFINVRRLFIMLRRTLDQGFAWVTFEPNTDATWSQLRSFTSSFLEDLWKKGMLVGGKPEEAFFVQCDAETNPADNIDKGILTCNIAVAPTKPTEFVMISMVQEMGTTSQ
jgi:phage tail sheath protein FI